MAPQHHQRAKANAERIGQHVVSRHHTVRGEGLGPFQQTAVHDNTYAKRQVESPARKHAICKYCEDVIDQQMGNLVEMLNPTAKRWPQRNVGNQGRVDDKDQRMHWLSWF